MYLRALSFALVAAALAAGSAMAQGRPQFTEGIYIGGSVGAHKPQNSSVSQGGQSTGIGLKTGLAGAASVGYAFGNGPRAELELAHRRSNANSAAAGQTASGSLDATSLMINGLYDIATGTSFVPYLGAGVGAARMRANNLGTLTNGASVDGSDTVFAYQGIAGLDYHLDANVALGASYRYFATGKADIAASAGTKASVPFRDHAVLLGMRWNFGASMAAPVPQQVQAPAPAPVATPRPQPQAPLPAPAAIAAGPRNFTVFFDFDKSIITPDAQRVLVEAANSAKAGAYTRISATGHTDTSGTPRYNMALSIRRANAVRDALVREGIPSTAIVVVGRGETQLLVPTPDQTREPRNRRVEIVIE
ncbi:MAG: OmpA family protein [Tagaea sp.]|nr:OmpA family protein [Tagaea sp.]